MKNKIPAFVLTACDCLNKYGYQAYIVGGAVRDMIMGRVPHDWDIATNARPDDIERVFAKENFVTIPTGKQYGTITVEMNDNLRSLIEVTTYRGHESYDHASRSGRARIVEFGDSILDDLAYRDFTMNAIAYEPFKVTYVDPLNGQFDIKRGYIVSVGDAKERFEEDPLRMMRAFRFQATLGFSVDKKIVEAATQMAEELSKISAERIRSELDKILMSPYDGFIWDAFGHLHVTSLMKYIIPELDKGWGMTQCGNHIYTVWDHNVRACTAMPQILEWRLAGLLHDIGKPDTMSDDPESGRHFYQHEYRGEVLVDQIMRRLKYSNDQIAFVKLMVRNHMWIYNDNSTLSVARRVIARVGIENIEPLLALRRADRAASGRKGDGGSIKRLRAAMEILSQQQSAFKVTDLAVSGHDIIALGVKPGPAIGNILKELLEAVLDERVENEKSQLINLAKTLI